MNQTPSTTAFDVTLADGSRERIDAEKVFIGGATYVHFRDRCRDIATSLGFEGHIAWAEAMP